MKDQQKKVSTKRGIMHRRTLLLVHYKVTAHPASGLIAINCWYVVKRKAARLIRSEINFNDFVLSCLCIVSEQYCERETYSSASLYPIYRYFVFVRVISNETISNLYNTSGVLLKKNQYVRYKHNMYQIFEYSNLDCFNISLNINEIYP